MKKELAWNVLQRMAAHENNLILRVNIREEQFVVSLYLFKGVVYGAVEMRCCRKL